MRFDERTHQLLNTFLTWLRDWENIGKLCQSSPEKGSELLPPDQAKGKERQASVEGQKQTALA